MHLFSEPAAPVKAEGESDRYAALADLDNTLRSLSFTSSTAETNPFAQASVCFIFMIDSVM